MNFTEYTAWYFIRSVPESSFSKIKSEVTPCSQAFVCTSCGERWAAIFIENAPWNIVAAPCSNHISRGVQDWNRTPGSILSSLLSRDVVGSGDWAIVLEHLPPPLLKREFNLWLKHYEERIHGTS